MSILTRHPCFLTSLSTHLFDECWSCRTLKTSQFPHYSLLCVLVSLVSFMHLNYFLCFFWGFIYFVVLKCHPCNLVPLVNTVAIWVCISPYKYAIISLSPCLIKVHWPCPLVPLILLSPCLVKVAVVCLLILDYCSLITLSPCLVNVALVCLLSLHPCSLITLSPYFSSPCLVNVAVVCLLNLHPCSLIILSPFSVSVAVVCLLILYHSSLITLFPYFSCPLVRSMLQ